MQINLPARVRASIYVVILLGTAVIVPLHTSHIVNDIIFSVWASLSGAASGLAALNTPKED